MRAQAIGRKNYLFVGSDRGGRTAATLYSLVGSCKRHQVDPFAYLKDVLERLPTHPVGAGELLPDAWSEAHPRGTTTSRFVRLEINEMARALERGYPRDSGDFFLGMPEMIDMRTRVRMRSLEKDRVLV